MLRLTDVAVARGARTLYRDVNLVASPAERVALVGANGSGKSSLLAAVLGDLALDGGSVEAPSVDRIAHVAQDIHASTESAIDYVLAGHAPLMTARAAIFQAAESTDELALAMAHADLAEMHEGAIVAAAHTVLAGLGFAPSDAERPVNAFSGGWRNRLALGRALMRPADLMLLDEPTNHLDLDSVIWLEAWLRRQPATVIIVSHDREFLDRCANVVWHVEDASIRRYAGNYTAFETASLERMRQRDASAREYARTAAHLTSFVERFRAQATKARQAQSRLKMLERLEAIEPVRARREWRFTFPVPRRLPAHLIDGDALNLGYGDKLILENLNFSVRAGDRIGVLGVNGAGKSTLVKALAGELLPLSGELRRGQGLAIGYFAQHQLDQLRPNDSPLEHLRRLAPTTREQELREFLGIYRFSGEMATSVVGPMSGGEKARCALALLAWARPNLLVLDEPTNHLDMETREALTMALSSFEGALLLVSHDRHLLRATTDTLWLVHDGKAGPYEGDLDDYTTFVLASRRAKDGSEGALTPSAGSINKKSDRKRETQGRQKHTELRKQLSAKQKQLETEISRLEATLKSLDERLTDPVFYNAGKPEEVAAVLKQRSVVAAELGVIEAEWLNLSSRLEGLASPA